MKPNATRLYEIYQAWVEALQDVSDVEGLRPGFVLNLLPKTAAAVAKTNGVGNTFGLEDDQSYICTYNRTVLLWWICTNRHQVWQFTTSWARAEDDLRMTTWHQSLLARHHEINKQLGIASDFVYMGDAGEWQKPYPAYGASNLEKLRQVRDQYDPNLVFTKLNWGGFKLGY